MRKTLEDLFQGNIAPNVKSFVKGTKYAKALNTAVETEEKLLRLLDGTERQLFEENSSAQSEVLSMAITEHFISGFRLGARIVMEVFAEDDGYLRDI